MQLLISWDMPVLHHVRPLTSAMAPIFAKDAAVLAIIAQINTYAPPVSLTSMLILPVLLLPTVPQALSQTSLPKLVLLALPLAPLVPSPLIIAPPVRVATCSTKTVVLRSAQEDTIIIAIFASPVAILVGTALHLLSVSLAPTTFSQLAPASPQLSVPQVLLQIIHQIRVQLVPSVARHAVHPLCAQAATLFMYSTITPVC